MTKKEFIEAIKDMPDDIEVKYFCLEYLSWETAIPYLINDKDGKQFIGIE